jgi:peptidoglycan/LPS O-acetylase OafA/YrhL
MRALAVVAVLVYHAHPGWLPGGFLGVDVFFVVSGFLITRLLLREHARTGRIRLRAFYLRRARRLLPALGVLVLAVALAGLSIWRGRPGLGADLTATLGYATNWWFIARHHSYFLTSGPPSPVGHLWSLAIEEQFYLLWPALLIVLLRGRRRGPALVAGAAAGVAVASTVLMAVLAVLDDVPYRTDSSRLYFGTDTHAMGLLLGAVLAALLARHGRLLRRVPPWCAEVLAAVALLGLVWCACAVSEYDPGLYRGGFLAVSALAALLVLACAHPHALAGAALQVRPLAWLGARSYEIYLWHWPVFLLIGPDNDPGWVVALADAPLRLLLTLVAADLTHRYVTLPVWRGWSSAPKARRWLRPVAVAALALAAVAGLLLQRPAQSQSPVSTLAAAGAPLTQQPAPAHAIAPVPAPQSAGAQSAGAQSAGPPPGASVRITEAVSAFGDSVLLGASPTLGELMPRLSVRATVGIQSAVVFSRVRAGLGALGPIVLIHTGNNGVVSSADLGRLLGQLAGEQLVVLVNDHLPRTWQGPNNHAFTAAAAGRANVSVVDWDAASRAHPEWFTPDRVHLQPVGARAYAALIAAAITDRLGAAATN